MKIVLQIEITAEEMKEHGLTFEDMKDDALELKETLTPGVDEKIIGKASVMLLDHFGNPIPFDHEEE